MGNDLERDFKGVWITREIWLDSRLNAIDKVVLAEIDSLDNENHCNASNEYLSKFCQCSQKTITRSINKLIELGYIKVISFDGRHRIIESCLGCMDKMSRLNSQDVQADRSKCPSININNNIVRNNKINKREFTEEDFTISEFNWLKG